MNKRRVLNPSNLPMRMNILWLPVVWMMVGYFGLPIWVFAVYATVWFLYFLLAVYSNMVSEKVNL